VNGGVDLAKHPIWIEGPHIYKRGQWYYLICAEGGTGINHSQVVFRSRTVWGPYEPYARNPILTQRDLPADRANPIINAGHADLIEGTDGSWWAVFLGSRAYGNGNYNTGRETFLLPVKWQDGWPVILEAGTAIPFALQGPAFMSGHSQAPLAGNFTWRDEFDRPALDRTWLQIRVPKQPWFDLSARKGMLAIEPLPIGLEALANPSFLGRRQQHTRFEASLRVQVPIAEGTAAGVAAFQKETHWYFLGTRRTPARLEVFLEKRANGEVATIARASLADASQLQLKVTGNGGSYAFFYDAGAGWRPLVENDDGSILSTEVAGGFVGTVIGPYARSESITK
jgi:alpha-N-arabinofuranosidase